MNLENHMGLQQPQNLFESQCLLWYLSENFKRKGGRCFLLNKESSIQMQYFMWLLPWDFHINYKPESGIRGQDAHHNN